MIQLLPGVQSTSAALAAERVRMDVIAQNIANANTTRGLDGQPYRRQLVVFESALQQAQLGSDTSPAENGPQVSRIQKDPRPGQAIYAPGHPHADATGTVRLPNVNLYEEMADLVAASRAFEANLAVVRNARQMALQTLAIGKR